MGRRDRGAGRVGNRRRAAILETLDRGRQRIETACRRERQCRRTSSREGGRMAEAAGTRVTPERDAARAAEWLGRGLHGGATGRAQADAVTVRQQALARLAVQGKHAVENYAEPVRHGGPRAARDRIVWTRAADASGG